MQEVMSVLAQLNCSMKHLVMKNRFLADLIQNCILQLLSANTNPSSTNLDLSLTNHVCNEMDKSNRNDFGSDLTSYMMKNFGKSGNHEKLTYERHTRDKIEKLTWDSDSLHQSIPQMENKYDRFNSRQESRSSGYQSNNGLALSPMLSPHSNNFEAAYVDSFRPSTSTPRHFNQPPTEKGQNQFLPSGGTENRSFASSSKAAAAASVPMDIPANSSQSNSLSSTTEKPHSSSTVNNIPVPQASNASHTQSSTTNNGTNQTNFSNNSFHSSHVTKSRSCEPGWNTSSNIGTHHYGLQKR